MSSPDQSGQDSTALHLIQILARWNNELRRICFTQNVQMMKLCNLSQDHAEKMLTKYYTSNPHLNPTMPIDIAFKIVCHMVKRANLCDESQENEPILPTNLSDESEMICDPPDYLDELNKYMKNSNSTFLDNNII